MHTPFSLLPYTRTNTYDSSLLARCLFTLVDARVRFYMHAYTKKRLSGNIICVWQVYTYSYTSMLTCVCFAFLHACIHNKISSLTFLPQNCLLFPPHIQVQKLEEDTASVENAKLAKFAEAKATLEKKNQELSEELVLMGKKYNMAVRATETAAGIFFSMLFFVYLSLSLSLRSSFFFPHSLARTRIFSPLYVSLSRVLSRPHTCALSLSL